MKAKQERYGVRSRIEWEDGERELLIAVAVARGEVTVVPSVEPATLANPNPKISSSPEAKLKVLGAEPSLSPQSDR